MSIGSQAGRAPGLKGIEPKLIPPRGARQVGVLEDAYGNQRKDRWGNLINIYEMEVPDLAAMKSAKRPKLDEHGKPVMGNANGPVENQYPMHEIPAEARKLTRTKRFILEGSPRGKVKMIEDFELTPEEIEEQKRLVRREAFIAELAEAAAAKNLSASQVLDGLDIALAPQAEQPTDPVEEDEPVMEIDREVVETTDAAEPVVAEVTDLATEPEPAA